MANGINKSLLASSAALTVLVATGCGSQSYNVTGVGSGVLAAQAAPGEAVVKFKNAAARQSLLQKMGLRTISKVGALDAVVVKCSDVKATVKGLQADPNVLYAEPNYIAKAVTGGQSPMLSLGLRAQSDELLGELWGMAKIKAPEAWAIADGSRVKVAVVDTGIDYNHPDFGGRVAKGYDFINNDADAMDDQSHGTHCAGTVGAGLGNGGVVGVAPNVELLAVKVLAANGSGSYSGVAAGITYAADQGSPIISMSLGGPAGSKVIEDAVKYAIGKGSLVVAAMGNDNSERPSYPASAPGVMAVGATTIKDERSSFSNFGKHISVSAPGTNIMSTMPNGKFRALSGTSMATPHVAGLAAMVKSKFPEMNADQIRKQIEATADDLGTAGFDKNFGAGRINALAAVQSKR